MSISLADIEEATSKQAWTGKFSTPLEEEYNRFRYIAAKETLERDFWPFLAVYNILLLADIFFVPDTLWLSLVIRFGIVCPAIVALQVYRNRFSSYKTLELAIASIPLLIALHVITIFALNSGVGSGNYQYFTALIILYSNVVNRLSLALVIKVTIIICCVYLLALFASTLPFEFKLGGVLLIMATSYITLKINQRVNLDARYIFLKQLEDKARRERAEAEANIDALTGLYNRRYLETIRSAEDFAYQASASTISVIMIDIDYFKAYNDHYGHPEGDRCLKAVASVIQSVVRGKGDVAVRYGGEEYLLMLHHAELTDGIDVADRIHDALLACSIPHAKNPDGPSVTASFGVHAGNLNETNLDDLIKQADNALYQAKKTGRNRVWPMLDN